MKNNLILFSFIILFSGCTKEHKSEKAIKKYLSENMNDFKSYEPLEFDKLDSVFNNRFENMYNAELILADSIRFQKKVYQFRSTDTDSLNKYSNLLEIASSKLQEGTKDYKRELIGFQQYHKFRAKNSFGGTVLHIGLFTFDPELKNVIKYEVN